MASLTAVRNALAAQISNYVQPSIETVLGYPLDQVPNLPAVLIFPGKPVAKFGITLGGAVLGETGALMAPTEFNLQAMVLVSEGTTIDRSQENLDQWLGLENEEGSVSIVAAVYADPTLGMQVDYCVPIQVSSVGPISYNGNTYWGGRIDFNISLQ